MGLTKSVRELKLIDADGETHILKIKRGRTLLEVAVENSVNLPHSCGGMGSCTTCRVKLSVAYGPNPERSEIEAERASERGYERNERLSCQLEIPKGDFRWTAESIGGDCT